MCVVATFGFCNRQATNVNDGTGTAANIIAPQEINQDSNGTVHFQDNYCCIRLIMNDDVITALGENITCIYSKM